MHAKWTIALLALAFGCAASAEMPATQPAPPTEAPAPPTTMPTTRPAPGAPTTAASPPTTTTSPTTATAPAVDPEAMRILRELEQAGEKHEGLRARVTYEVIDRLTGDSETREGRVFFLRGSDRRPTKFRISFRTLQQAGGPKILARVDYAFDGHWLTVAKHRIKQMTRYQVVTEGERAQPLKLGKGPFPVPFGQKADDVLEYFHVSTRPLREGEPENTDYLKLVTRESRSEEVNFNRLEMWVDRKTHLPVKLVSRDKSERMTAVTFENIETGVELSEETFRLPRRLGWQYRVERLEQRTEPQAP
jgi:outer membrane lipoprotein-sorting protein